MPAIIHILVFTYGRQPTYLKVQSHITLCCAPTKAGLGEKWQNNLTYFYVAYIAVIYFNNCRIAFILVSVRFLL